MSEPTSTKPYMVRALHEWCTDNGFTPHLLVVVNAQTRVPLAYVKNGEIVLNLSYSATKNLFISNEAITFSARFGGISNDLYIPFETVRGIFARENGQGMFFPVGESSSDEAHSVETEGKENQFSTPQADKNVAFDTLKKPNVVKKPTLTLVK